MSTPIYIVSVNYDNRVKEMFEFENAKLQAEAFEKLCVMFGTEAEDEHFEDGHVNLDCGHTICLSTVYRVTPEQIAVEKIFVMEDTLIDAVMERLRKCDGDELARIGGEVLGGDCFQGNGQYEFTPNENYTGGLDSEQ